MAYKTTYDKYKNPIRWYSVDAAMGKDDGVLFRKWAGVLYKRHHNQPYYPAEFWGIEPNQPEKRWDVQIKQALETIPEGKTLYLPKGDYTYNDTIMVDRQVRVQGDGDFHTSLIKIKPGLCMLVHPKARHTTLERFTIKSHVKDSADGLLPDGTYSDNILDYKNHGILVLGVVTLREVTSRNHSGHAFMHEGNIWAGTDASNSKVYDCNAIECNGGGFTSLGGDANSIGYYNCDYRDLGGAGFWQGDFLGNTIINPMGHYAGKGDYRFMNNTQRPTIIGVYGEGGNKVASRFNHLTTIAGGIMESPYNGGYRFEGEHVHGQSRQGGIKMSESRIDLGRLILQPRAAGNFGMGINEGPQDGFTGFLEPGGEFHTNYASKNKSTRKTSLTASYSFVSFIGNVAFGAINNNLEYELTQPPYNAFEFWQGDELKNRAYNGSNTYKWVCIADGVGPAAKFKEIKL